MATRPASTLKWQKQVHGQRKNLEGNKLNIDKKPSKARLNLKYLLFNIKWINNSKAKYFRRTRNVKFGRKKYPKQSRITCLNCKWSLDSFYRWLWPRIKFLLESILKLFWKPKRVNQKCICETNQTHDTEVHDIKHFSGPQFLKSGPFFWIFLKS